MDVAESNPVVRGPPAIPPPSPAAVFPRQEIDVFVKDSDVLNIFLQALAEMQNNDDRNWIDNPRSYFQISAIHGFKLPLWDIPPDQLKDLLSLPSFDNRGFCTHSSVLFPSWHRVYLILFEQELLRLAGVIASQYQDKTLSQKYSEAAKRLRLPYWDPLVVRGVKNHEPQWYVPYILGTPNVWLRLPGAGKEGKLTMRPNPLYSYILPPRSEVQAKAIKNIPSVAQGFTVRSPDWVNVKLKTEQHEDLRMKSNHARTNEQLLLGQVGSTNTINVSLSSKFERLFNLLDGAKVTWNEFSNTDWKTTVNTAAVAHEGPQGSIEGWHDDIHGMVGYNWHISDTTVADRAGSMADVPSSSFDPIFWLHHCNIDRLVAAYQMTHPDEWVADFKDAKIDKLEQHETFEDSPWVKRKQWAPLGSPPDVIERLRRQGVTAVTLPTSREFSTTPLLPFRKSNDLGKLASEAWWNSDDVRDWTKLGYTYDGIQFCSQKSDKEAIIRQGREFAARKYGWMTTSNYLSPKSYNGVFPAFLDETAHEVFEKPVTYDKNDARAIPKVGHDDPPSQTPQPTPQPHPPPKSSDPPDLSASIKRPTNIFSDPRFLNPNLRKETDEEKERKEKKELELKNKKAEEPDDSTIYQDYSGVKVTRELEFKDQVPGPASTQASEAGVVPIPAASALSVGLAEGSLELKALIEKFKTSKVLLCEWDIVMHIRKFVLGGPFSVFFFLGDYIKAEPATWVSSSNGSLISVNYVFANSNLADCANCVVLDKNMVEYVDSLSLTPRLVQALGQGELANLGAAEVNGYLKKHLWFEVVDQMGQIQTQSANIDSLGLDLMHREITWDSNGKVVRGPVVFEQQVTGFFKKPPEAT